MIAIPEMATGEYVRVDVNKSWLEVQKHLIGLADNYGFVPREGSVWMRRFLANQPDPVIAEDLMRDAEAYLSSLAPIGYSGYWVDGVWGIWEDLA
jgi:hypothetical protein